MTGKQSKQRADDMSDAAVSKTYREIATERTPASLNESVLRQAVRRSGRGYSRSIVWLRPMAWAATIGLCLAIVLELAEVPEPDFEIIEERPHTAAARADAAGGEQFEAALPAAIPAQNSDPGTAAATKAPGRELRNVASEAAPVYDNAASELSAFQVTDAPMLEEAAAAARMRDGPSRSAAPTTINALTSGDASEPRCDEVARATPETWLDCVKELREAGREAHADEEQRKLEAAYPDFPIP